MKKISICLLLLLLFPLFWGSALQYVWQFHKKQKTYGSCALTGWLCFLTGFELLAVMTAVRGWQLQRLVRLTVLWALILTGAVVTLCFGRGYQSFVRGRLKQMTAKENRPLALAFLVAFVCIAGVYVLQGFHPENYQSVPQEVTTILGVGRLCQVNPLTGQAYGAVHVTEKLYQLPALYAVFAGLFGMRTEMLLFGLMPYLCLAGMLLAVMEFSNLFFEKTAMRAVMLPAFAAVILCGGSAYMNVPYDILHAPYEGAALLGGLWLPYLFAILLRIWKERRSVRIGGACKGMVQIVSCLAVSLLTAGVAKGLLPACMEVALFVVSAGFVSVIQRRAGNDKVRK